jgi:hypothetical protein
MTSPQPVSSAKKKTPEIPDWLKSYKIPKKTKSSTGTRDEPKPEPIATMLSRPTERPRSPPSSRDPRRHHSRKSVSQKPVSVRAVPYHEPYVPQFVSMYTCAQCGLSMPEKDSAKHMADHFMASYQYPQTTVFPQLVFPQTYAPPPPQPPPIQNPPVDVAAILQSLHASGLFSQPSYNAPMGWQPC